MTLEKAFEPRMNTDELIREMLGITHGFHPMGDLGKPQSL